VRRAILLLLLSSLTAACGADTIPSTPPDESGEPPIAGLDLAYTCGRFPFGPALVAAGMGTAEQEPNPAAAALRRHLTGPGPDIDFLPDTGWLLAGMDDRGAEFITRGGEMGLLSVSVEPAATGWQVTGWGDCTPRLVLPDGIGPAAWRLAPEQAPIGPETQVFDALVSEMACASGRSADGRILPPIVARGDGEVLVAFAVRSLAGGQDCPSNPESRVRVDLGEPLGDRRLLDGGTVPAADPSRPAP
jgi:hypothetical protein